LGHYKRGGIRHEKLKINVDMPALMHVCRESRQICLEKYSVKLACDTSLPSDCARFDPEEGIIYARDLALCFEIYSGSRRFSNKALNTIPFLVIEYDNWCDIERNFETVNFTAFSSLKELTVVLEDNGVEMHCECCEVNNRLLGEDITVVDSPLSDGLMITRDRLLFQMQWLIREHHKSDWKIPDIKFGGLLKEERVPRRM
jgi:hypothetical protein